MAHDLSGLDFAVRQTAALADDEREELLHHFQANYRRANPAFLRRSLERLRYVALSRHGGRLVGFGVADTRVMDLPRLPAQAVILAGLSCVAPEFRRRGIFGELVRLASAAAEVPASPRRLLCGRMAHPAAMRGLARHPTVVPKPGVQPTPWQQAVGAGIAAAYGVNAFDPLTFVCRGDGEPIGYPKIEFDLEPHEWEVFEPVNRDRGDALLAIAWGPDAPEGW